MGSLLDRMERFVESRVRTNLSAQRSATASRPESTSPESPVMRDRSFLPRPITADGTEPFWHAWAPFMDELITYSAARFHAICDAEDALHRLEQRGVTCGPAYDLACAKLQREFEDGRRFMLSQNTKIWVH